jgi:hypothetical protein
MKITKIILIMLMANNSNWNIPENHPHENVSLKNIKNNILKIFIFRLSIL